MATEKELRNNVANWLNAYKGIKEGSSEHKKILSIFNDSKLCTRYKMTVNDAWCATAASCPFIDLGITGIFPCVECSCSKMISLASSAGIWVEDDGYMPSIGDLMLYDWGDSANYATTDNKGNPDHVGIVQDVNGDEITVIEGNKDDTVGTRKVAVNGKYIRGYITPNYASIATKESSSSSSCSSSLAIGDTVTYNGSVHYSSANATDAKSCKGGEAQITQICKGAKHPYHLVHSGSGCTVYGWVDESDIKGAGSSSSSSSSSNSSSSSSSEKKASEAAQSYSSSLAGTYKTTANLNVRNGAGTNKSILVTLPKGTSVQNYGYYTTVSGVKWLYIQATYNSVKYTGFASSDYLTK